MALEQMPSQFSDRDSWTWGRTEDASEDEETRMRMRIENLMNRNVNIANRYWQNLIELYGEEIGNSIEYAEALQLSEFGRQVSHEELKKLFPSFD